MYWTVREEELIGYLHVIQFSQSDEAEEIDAGKYLYRKKIGAK